MLLLVGLLMDVLLEQTQSRGAGSGREDEGNGDRAETMLPGSVALTGREKRHTVGGGAGGSGKGLPRHFVSDGGRWKQTSQVNGGRRETPGREGCVVTQLAPAD